MHLIKWQPVSIYLLLERRQLSYTTPPKCKWSHTYLPKLLNTLGHHLPKHLTSQLQNLNSEGMLPDKSFEKIFS